MNEKEQIDIDIEAPGVPKKHLRMPSLPKSLTIEEKKYLLAVERGDMANVRRMIQKAYRKKLIDINCVDSLGRGALTLAIDGENLEMVELLVILGVETKDALLHAINVEFVEAVELLLEHEELIHKEGDPYSWQKVEMTTGTFMPDITPLILAAHRNNYEIIKILLDRGATLPMPHDIKCGCDECIRESNEDSLRFSLARVNEYRALASPSLIALSSNDPLLTAFQLSWELRNLAFNEQEYKSEYLELRYQCQKFAVDLLHQTRSSQELAIILNHDPDNPPYEEGEHMKLTRLVKAIDYKQKKFVAHPNIQQLLAAIWYEGVPGFRRKTAIQKFLITTRVAVFFPFYCSLYMIAPNTTTGKLMRKPFMKFLIHASSYLFFLFILILVSLRAEVLVIELFGSENMRRNLEEQLMKQRGNGPTYLELLVVVYVLGFIWEETHEIYIEGMRSYLKNMWNFIDFTRNSLYCAVVLLRVTAFLQQMSEIKKDPSTAFIPRENWDAFDPQLIAEGLFAAANILSALKLVHLFSINPHLGPLQISLGRMVIDIVKFFFIYSLVLFAFACGLNQLLWYFADLERKKCYTLPGGLPDWENAGDSCMKWRSFGNVFEASQSLFWASFGMVGLENFELAGIKSYTRFWGLLMFGSYSVINVIVLLNLLIAMMSNSYAIIEEHSDVEWKFARTRLWMSYFEESATLPPPFNIFPTPKLLMKLLGLRKKDKLRRMSTKRRNREEKERDYRYTSVMRALVWRYVCVMHRRCEEDPVTEDDINEVKGDISAFRYELLEVLERNGMDVSTAAKKEKTVLGKRMKIWERRLMKDFQVAPVAGDDDMEQLITQPPPENEDSLAKFRRIAKLAVLNSSSHKWGQVVQGVCESSQIGRCNNRDSFRNQQYLQKAMEEARKLVLKSPLPDRSKSASPIEMPDTTGSTLKEILKDIKQDVEEVGGAPFGSSSNLLVQTCNNRSSPTSIVSHMTTKPPSRTISPLPPKSVKSMEATISSPSDTKSLERATSILRKPQSPTPSISKQQSPVLEITPPEVITSSKPDTPDDLTKPQTPDIEIKDTDEKKSLISTPSVVIEPATPVKSKSTTPDAHEKEIPEEKISEEPEIKSEKIKDEEKKEEPRKEVPTEELIDIEVPEAKMEVVDETKKSEESPSKVTKRRALTPTPTDIAIAKMEVVDETKKSEESPSKVTKRRAPTPTPIDIAISRPVPSEKPTDQGMLPPPPSKSKPPAPQPTQEPKPPITPTIPEEPKPSAEDVQEVLVSTSSDSENAAIAVSSDLISMPSTEKLIPKEVKPPVPLRPVRKTDDIKPVRRQPKTGWL